MATPTIPNGETQFFPIIYSGNGTAQRVGKFVPFTDNGTIAKSVIFNDDDSASLSKTAGGSPSSTRQFTISFWVKRCALGSDKSLITLSTLSGSTLNPVLQFTSSNQIQWVTSGGSAVNKVSNRTFEDTSKWYHILVSIDTTQSTANNRNRIYVDGDEITSWATNTNPSQNADYVLASGLQTIGNLSGGSQYFDGYLAEVNYVDGSALTPSTFGITDTSTGRWIPKTLTGITYGTNGFRLQFGTDSALGDDTSGNTNDFTATNLATTDQRTDSPTNNLPIMRPYNPSYSQTLAEGNLKTTTGGTNVGYPMCATLRPKGSGKYYAECRVSGDGGGNTVDLGVYEQETMHNYSSGNWYPGNNNGSGWNSITGGYAGRGFYQQVNGSSVNVQFISETIAAGDVIGMALDLDNGLLSYYNNSGSLVGSVPIDRTKSAIFTAMSNTNITFDWNFGDNSTFNGNETAGGNADSDGNGNFYHSVPTGFKMLRQDNMPETDKGVSGLTWTKDRDATASWMCIDSSRIYTAEGVPGAMNLDNTNKEYGQVDFVDGINKFLKGGFAVATSNNTYSYINKSGNANVSYSWVGNGGTTASNSDGSITSSVQANTTAGFSIVTYTGTGSAATVGHGLSSAPKWIIVKQRNTDGEGWYMYHHSIGNAKYLLLNTTAAPGSGTLWNSTSPTSSVFSLGGGGVGININTNTYVAYCWNEVEGFSKFGKFVGNGTDTDGPFIYTGFKPAFIIFKANRITNYYSHDGARNPTNPVTIGIDPNTTAAEYSSSVVGNGLDFVSNGFKIKQATGLGYNYTGEEIYYMAFAKQSFLGDGTNPGTAR